MPRSPKQSLTVVADAGPAPLPVTVHYWAVVRGGGPTRVGNIGRRYHYATGFPGDRLWSRSPAVLVVCADGWPADRVAAAGDYAAVYVGSGRWVAAAVQDLADFAAKDTLPNGHQSLMNSLYEDLSRQYGSVLNPDEKAAWDVVRLRLGGRDVRAGVEHMCRECPKFPDHFRRQCTAARENCDAPVLRQLRTPPPDFGRVTLPADRRYDLRDVGGREPTTHGYDYPIMAAYGCNTFRATTGGVDGRVDWEAGERLDLVPSRTDRFVQRHLCPACLLHPAAARPEGQPWLLGERRCGPAACHASLRAGSGEQWDGIAHDVHCCPGPVTRERMEQITERHPLHPWQWQLLLTRDPDRNITAAGMGRPVTFRVVRPEADEVRLRVLGDDAEVEPGERHDSLHDGYCRMSIDAVMRLTNAASVSLDGDLIDELTADWQNRLAVRALMHGRLDRLFTTKKPDDPRGSYGPCWRYRPLTACYFTPNGAGRMRLMLEFGSYASVLLDTHADFGQFFYNGEHGGGWAAGQHHDLGWLSAGREIDHAIRFQRIHRAAQRVAWRNPDHAIDAARLAAIADAHEPDPDNDLGGMGAGGIADQYTKTSTVQLTLRGRTLPCFIKS